MRFARRLVLLPLLSLLAACSPTTPLFVAQVTTGEVAEYKQMKSNRMTAAIEEEGDLLTYSAMAIRDNRSAEAESSTSPATTIAATAPRCAVSRCTRSA